MQNDLFNTEYFNIFSYRVQKNTNKATGALAQVCFPMPPDGTTIQGVTLRKPVHRWLVCIQ